MKIRNLNVNEIMRARKILDIGNNYDVVMDMIEQSKAGGYYEGIDVHSLQKDDLILLDYVVDCMNDGIISEKLEEDSSEFDNVIVDNLNMEELEQLKVKMKHRESELRKLERQKQLHKNMEFIESHSSMGLLMVIYNDLVVLEDDYNEKIISHKPKHEQFETLVEIADNLGQLVCDFETDIREVINDMGIFDITL